MKYVLGHRYDPQFRARQEEAGQNVVEKEGLRIWLQGFVKQGDVHAEVLPGTLSRPKSRSMDVTCWSKR